MDEFTKEYLVFVHFGLCQKQNTGPFRLIALPDQISFPDQTDFECQQLLYQELSVISDEVSNLTLLPTNIRKSSLKLEFAVQEIQSEI